MEGSIRRCPPLHTRHACLGGYQPIRKKAIQCFRWGGAAGRAGWRGISNRFSSRKKYSIQGDPVSQQHAGTNHYRLPGRNIFDTGPKTARGGAAFAKNGTFAFGTRPLAATCWASSHRVGGRLKLRTPQGVKSAHPNGAIDRAAGCSSPPICC